MTVFPPLLGTLRAVRRTPVFTALIVATLAVGIGATTLVFSIADGLVLNPFPYPEPNRLVGVGAAYPKLNAELDFWEVLSPPEYLDIANQSGTLTGVVAWDMGNRQIDEVVLGAPVELHQSQVRAAPFLAIAARRKTETLVPRIIHSALCAIPQPELVSNPAYGSIRRDRPVVRRPSLPQTQHDIGCGIDAAGVGIELFPDPVLEWKRVVVECKEHDFVQVVGSAGLFGQHDPSPYGLGPIEPV